MISIRTWIAVAMFPLAACTVEKAPAQSPPPPPPAAGPAAAAPPVTAISRLPCIVGSWKVGSGAGEQQIMITEGGAGGAYDVKYKGTNISGGGAATVSENQMTVDMGQSSGGLLKCTPTPECTAMSCSVAGQPPTTFTKVGG